jgi:hypothetical protein
MHIGDDARSRGQARRDAIGQLHEPIPGRPAAQPLASALDKERRRAHDAAISRLILERAHLSL